MTDHMSASNAPQMFLLVGLGNPGRQYRETRHNVGFMVVDQIAKELNIKLGRVQSKAIMGTGEHAGNKIILAKPQTFMNLSGQAVAGLMRFYKIPISNLLVAHDDLDLPLGTLRMRPGGGSAGQKGLGSTIERLGTQEFPRLRVGIGRPPGQMDAAEYVLREIPSGDQEILRAVLERAAEAALVFIEYGLDEAMNRYNGSLTKE